MLLAILDILYMLLSLAGVIIFVQVILGWLVAFNVINMYNRFVRQIVDTLDRITRPLYRPIRKILPDFGGLDFSPLFVLLIIWVLQRLLRGAM
jgi:YggT family protein